MQDAKDGTRDAHIDLSAAFTKIGGLIGNRRIRVALAGFFVFQLGWSLFYQFILYLFRIEFGMSASETAYVLTMIGVGMVLAFCWLIGKVRPLASSKALSMLNSAALVVLTPLLPVLIHLHWLVLAGWALLMATAYGLGYSATLVLVLSLEDESHQGLILGSAASLAALSATVTALSGSSFAGLGALALLGLVSGCFLAAAAGRKRKAPVVSSPQA
ncbi:MAG: hypothetical protein FD153_1138 [Rhodospirillaceae bacterium]|nr:MAG: hypothetical protein FD153_1138 [Rhodospirillaceae bacterium]